MNLDLYNAKQKLYGLKATVKGYPEIKAKVKAATNLDPWGPTQAQMVEICEACNNYENKRIVMKALWKRVTQTQNKDWPHVYKALAIFEHLLLHGPFSIQDEIKEQLYNLRTLHDFHYVDEKGQDKGLAIREKSKKIVEWVGDAALLQEERNKSAALQSKYVGISGTGDTRDISHVGGGSHGSSGGMGGMVERATHPQYERTFSNITPTVPSTTTNYAAANDVAALAADEDYVRQQQQILESIEKEKARKAQAGGAQPDLFAEANFNASFGSDQAPAVPKPGPATAVSSGLFDPFPNTTPAPAASSGPGLRRPSAGNIQTAPAPTPAPQAQSAANDVMDFFSAAPAAQPTDFDPFASPPSAPAQASAPAPFVEDLFAAPAPAPSSTDQTNLFAGGDPFASADPFSSAGGQSAQPHAEEKHKTTFQDTNFDVLCNLDAMSMKPGTMMAPSPSAKPGPSMKEQRAMKMQQQQQMSPGQPGGATASGDLFNPFL
jgi:epsin